GAVALAEEPEVIRKLVRRAVTDAGPQPAGEMSPGVKNLFLLLESFAAPDVVQKFKEDYDRGELRYVELKDAVAEAMIAGLAPIRERRAELLARREQLRELLNEGARCARRIAQETMREVRERMGLQLWSPAGRRAASQGRGACRVRCTRIRVTRAPRSPITSETNPLTRAASPILGFLPRRCEPKPPRVSKPT